ncbi:hypothetical protein J3A83DRAFT_4356546 [Scleroderma citrinum]
MVLTVPLIIFMDDMLGNVSKQWNKHHLVCMFNASMSHEMLEKEFCVHFVSSSPHATSLELSKGIKDSIEKAATDGIIAWDCKLQQEVMLIPYKLCIYGGDNPMQAEECSHGGLKCKYLCHTCRVGGTNVEKKFDKGYCEIFKVCFRFLFVGGTLAEVKAQLELAKQPGGTEKVKNAISKSGTQDAASTAIVDCLLELRKRLRKQEAGVTALSEAEVCAQLELQSVDDAINPLLGMKGLDIHQDTPTENLHTILLSVVKYHWGQTVYILDKAHLLGIFQSCLESINTDGLNSPTLDADYIVQFKESLIGKHFKSLAQAFLSGWTVIGELAILLWHAKMDNIEEYLICNPLV